MNIPNLLARMDVDELRLFYHLLCSIPLNHCTNDELLLRKRLFEEPRLKEWIISEPQ